MTAAAQIRRALRTQAADVAHLIATAFDVLPAARWLIPDAAHRQILLPATFLITVEHALAHGEVHIADNGAAAAVWYDHTRPVPPIVDYDTRLAAAAGGYAGRFRTLDQLLAEHHPAAPHHHLALLAVRPDRHGRGLATALLRHHHEHLDRYAIPAYLEASSTTNRRLYRHHGYATGQPFYLPDGPPLWPMWREPGLGAAVAPSTAALSQTHDDGSATLTRWATNEAPGPYASRPERESGTGFI